MSPLSPTVRQERHGDVRTVRAVIQAAFEQDTEADLLDRIRTSRSYIAELSLVAEVSNEIVGHVLFSLAEVEGAKDARMLVLGPVGVLPIWQRQGIGSALIREGIRRAATLGFRGVALIGHPEYYPRFGFMPGSRLGLRSTYDVPDEVFMALPLAQASLEGVGGLLHFPPEFAGV